jgi:hypothetical protein
LNELATCKPYLQVREEGHRRITRNIKYYNLDVIIAIGYRVRSHRGTQFRQWATEKLKAYLTQGFLLDDTRFKRGEDNDYFENLLERIRDIRASEKVFWKKVLDIYATSIDYNPSLKTSKQFFATLQNKMHWAAHGHTAAEIINLRANAQAPNMGLTSWDSVSTGGAIQKKDITIAKNYLKEDEVKMLNRIVNAYLEFADLQAQNRRPMAMKDWISKLDDFLKLSEREILTHAGKITNELAETKAKTEFTTYKKIQINLPSRAEQDFEKVLLEPTKVLTKKRKK